MNKIKEIPDEKLKRTILEKFNASISKDDNPITISRKISIVLSEIYQSEIQTAGLNLNKDPNYKGVDKIFLTLDMVSFKDKLNILHNIRELLKSFPADATVNQKLTYWNAFNTKTLQNEKELNLASKVEKAAKEVQKSIKADENNSILQV